MFNIKNYRLGFEFCGFILTIAILLPTLIWTTVPAPHDVLRSAVTTTPLGIAAIVLRSLTMLASMFVVNRESGEPYFNVEALLIFSFGAIYYAGWFLYYAGLACVVALVFIAVAPVVMFVSLAVDRKNMFSLTLSIAFAALHLVCIIIGITSMTV